jgi:peptidylprolyl isomerase
MTTENETNNLTTAAAGSVVSVHYCGTLEDGTEFDNSRTRGEPIKFTVGSGQMIPGFDTAVNGMTIGDTVSVKLPPTEAYGNINPEAKTTFPKSGFPEDLELVEGMAVPLRTQTGQVMMGRLAEQQEDTVTIDLNHPLAGETLNFDIELLEVNS